MAKGADLNQLFTYMVAVGEWVSVLFYLLAKTPFLLSHTFIFKFHDGVKTEENKKKDNILNSKA